jgi:hypothetical protein
MNDMFEAVSDVSYSLYNKRPVDETWKEKLD